MTPVSLKIDLEHMAEHAEEATLLLKALANKNRLMILCLLSEGELSVGELQSRLLLGQSALSQHLAVLRQDKLVRTRRASQTIYYSLADKRSASIIELLHDMYCV
ncbi:MAG: metalloregulator ArsR/SmtB family transcription factor [Congregibacter sp.]|nr:metalloregulator ArsR/SmtB family transcription factor [Congregibacter sp.]